jgi:hypothetical protein
MHVFTHTFDYIVLGILVACMFLAAAKVLQRRQIRWRSLRQARHLFKL